MSLGHAPPNLVPNRMLPVVSYVRVEACHKDAAPLLGDDDAKHARKGLTRPRLITCRNAALLAAILLAAFALTGVIYLRETKVDLSGLYGKVESCYKIIAEHPHQMNLTAANFIRDPENEMLKKEIVELKDNLAKQRRLAEVLVLKLDQFKVKEKLEYEFDSIRKGSDNEEVLD